jgi:putative oxygen-independent coproporphyrinogen III oxidase
MANWITGGFGLYLHWPYCQSKCPYCDFNSHVMGVVDQNLWREAYLAEIARYAEETAGNLLQTIYFGGGTPSLMEPELVSDIIAAIQKAWPTANDLEITLEANPGSVEVGRFEAYRAGGVNRVSLGLQALNDDALKALGRAHTKTEALDALDVAKSTFDRVNFDLIYARQFQTLDEWRIELSEALAMAGDHLSLYQLTVEEGTVFHKRATFGKLPGLPEEDLGAEMYELTQEMTSAAGLPAYEVSNHARKGSESRHNMTYWRGGDYVGIGPGAHGRITGPEGRASTVAHKNPAKWLQSVRKSGHGESEREILRPDEVAIEYLLMAMRTNEGVNLERYHAMQGEMLSREKIQHLTDLGLVETSEDHLKTTAKGRPLLNGILRDLCD